ncbi:MAG: hypothetical protein ABIQ52_03900, partial [Vicinamibacterales bacterium]
MERRAERCFRFGAAAGVLIEHRQSDIDPLIVRSQRQRVFQGLFRVRELPDRPVELRQGEPRSRG